MDIKNEFNNCVEEYCKLDTYKKREININNLIETIAVLDKVANDVSNPKELLLNKELLDVKNLKECSEDDYNEALFVYIVFHFFYLNPFSPPIILYVFFSFLWQVWTRIYPRSIYSYFKM